MADVRWWLLALLVVMVEAKTRAIDQNQLAVIVDTILNKLNVQSKMPMFSLAVRIPLSHDQASYDLNQVSDSGQEVRSTILQCGVYQSSHVVAATLLKWPDVLKHCPGASVPWQDVLDECQRTSMTWQEVEQYCPSRVENNRVDHAEYRVLTTLDTWAADKKKTGLLLFYVYASPCTSRCTSERNALSILGLVERVKDWPQHAVVFSKVFQPKGNQYAISEKQLKQGLINLGSHLGSGGLGTIFRCDKNNGGKTKGNVDDNMQCVSCSSGGQVTPHCYSDTQHQQVTQQGGRGLCTTRGRGGSGRGRGGLGRGRRRRRRSLQKRPTEHDVCELTPPGRRSTKHQEKSRRQRVSQLPAGGPASAPRRGGGDGSPRKGPGRKAKKGRSHTDLNKGGKQKRGGTKRGRGRASQGRGRGRGW